MTGLPEGLSINDEIEVEWERDADSTRIFASLGGAMVGIECEHGSADTIPWLLAAMPSVLEAAWANIETTQEENSGND